jgi:hypothetical protein
MTISTLYPAFVQTVYSSAYAASHILNLGLRDWQGGVDTGVELGLSTSWNEGNANVLTDLQDLFDVLITQWPATVSILRSTVFTIEEPGGVARPRASYTHTALVGTDATPGVTKAVQKTFTMYDTLFNHVRIQLMDAASNDNWAKQTDWSASPASDLIAVFGDADRAFASRKGHRPNVGISIINKFNDKLRHSYGMD